MDKYLAMATSHSGSSNSGNKSSKNQFFLFITKVY